MVGELEGSGGGRSAAGVGFVEPAVAHFGKGKRKGKDGDGIWVWFELNIDGIRRKVVGEVVRVRDEFVEGRRNRWLLLHSNSLPTLSLFVSFLFFIFS